MRRRLAAAIAAAALAFSIGDPASAHRAQGRWSGNHTLMCHFGCGPDTGASVGEGDIVALWQQILYSDGFLGLCGSTGIDGRFGPRTHNATHAWQQYYSEYATNTVVEALHGATQFYVDGIVGPQSWSLAESFLIPTGPMESWPGYSYLYPGRIDARDFVVNEAFVAPSPDTDGIAFVFYFEPLSDWDAWDVGTGHPGVTYPAC